MYFLNWCQGQTNFFYNIFSIKLDLQEIADFRFVRKESVAENRYFKKNILQSKQFEPLHQKPHISDREFVKLNKTFFCFFALPQMVLSELWNNFLRYRNNMINFFYVPRLKLQFTKLHQQISVKISEWNWELSNVIQFFRDLQFKVRIFLEFYIRWVTDPQPNISKDVLRLLWNDSRIEWRPQKISFEKHEPSHSFGGNTGNRGRRLS